MFRTATACAISLLLTFPGKADTPDGTYEYGIQHPQYGEIGTYTNLVRRDGDDEVVETRIDVSVQILFVEVHSMKSERREEYRDGRIVGFSSMTREGDRVEEVRGYARDDQFILEGPGGREEAPADVFPTNPWTVRILDADMLFSTANGILLEATVKGGETQEIDVGGRTIPTRHYRVSGDVEHELWFDEQGVPIRFTAIQKGTPVVFTLKE